MPPPHVTVQLPHDPQGPMPPTQGSVPQGIVRTGRSPSSPQTVPPTQVRTCNCSPPPHSSEHPPRFFQSDQTPANQRESQFCLTNSAAAFFSLDQPRFSEPKCVLSRAYFNVGICSRFEFHDLKQALPRQILYKLFLPIFVQGNFVLGLK